jgi:hypothetical protein
VEALRPVLHLRLPVRRSGDVRSLANVAPGGIDVLRREGEVVAAPLEHAPEARPARIVERLLRIECDEDEPRPRLEREPSESASFEPRQGGVLGAGHAAQPTVEAVVPAAVDAAKLRAVPAR